MSSAHLFQQADLIDELQLASDECARLLEMIALLKPVLHEFGRRQLRNVYVAMNQRVQRLREELMSLEQGDDSPFAA